MIVHRKGVSPCELTPAGGGACMRRDVALAAFSCRSTTAASLTQSAALTVWRGPSSACQRCRWLRGPRICGCSCTSTWQVCGGGGGSGAQRICIVTPAACFQAAMHAATLPFCHTCCHAAAADYTLWPHRQQPLPQNLARGAYAAWRQTLGSEVAAAAAMSPAEVRQGCERGGRFCTALCIAMRLT